MTFPISSNFEVRQSKTEHEVPVIDEILLHSIYNPIKETDSFISKYEDQIRTKDSFIVLGLGFGYHIERLIQELKSLGKKSFKIIVVEPNQRTVDECLARGLVNTDHVSIYTNTNLESLYSDLSYVSHLLSKPAVLAHSASLNLYNEYYRAALTWEAPKDMQYFGKTIDQNLKTLLTEERDTVDYEDFVSHITSKRTLNQLDHLVMAMEELKKIQGVKNV